MSIADIKRFFSQHDEDESLVLATVYETDGSTYSKAGERMLINAAGDFQGMLSGGCLEGDLAERAREVASSGASQTVTYDMRGEDDVLWGLGVGCEGMMRVFLQPLSGADDFAPFPAILSALGGDQPSAIATVIRSAAEDVQPGATLLSGGGDHNVRDMPPSLRAQLEPLLAAAVAKREAGVRSVREGKQAVDVLFSLLEPPPRVLILGGGLDAEPVLALCASLGWRVTIQDHREAYLQKGDFSQAEDVCCHPPAAIGQALALERFDAAVVMSHHLLTDREYLAQLAAHSLRYVGLLGPPKRRQRLVADLGEQVPKNLRGPAGIDIGGRGPHSIALSIVAEMHRALMRD